MIRCPFSIFTIQIYTYRFPMEPFTRYSEPLIFISFIIDDSQMDGVLLNGARLQNNPLIQDFTSFQVPGSSDLMVGVIALNRSDDIELYVLRHESGFKFSGIMDVLRTHDGESRALGYPLVLVNQVSMCKYIIFFRNMT